MNKKVFKKVVKNVKSGQDFVKSCQKTVKRLSKSCPIYKKVKCKKNKIRKRVGEEEEGEGEGEEGEGEEGDL
jgi:hypothetical protein